MSGFILVSEEDWDGLQARKRFLERELAFVLQRSKDSEALERAAVNAKFAAEWKKKAENPSHPCTHRPGYGHAGPCFDKCPERQNGWRYGKQLQDWRNPLLNPNYQAWMYYD